MRRISFSFNDLTKICLFLLGLVVALPGSVFGVIQEGQGTVTLNPPFCGDVLDNALTYTPELIVKAQEVLGPERVISPQQWHGPERAHFEGFGELGQDGINLATADNYTPRQIARKARILLKEGFNVSEIRALMKAHAVGFLTDLSLMDGLAVDPNTGKRVRVIRASDADPIVEERVSFSTCG